MKEKKRLKASYQEYFRFYKKMKLGVNKASYFLKDLELELKKLPLAKESELYFLNDETQTKIFIPQDQVYKVEFWLRKLMLKYYVEHSEMLYLEEYNAVQQQFKAVIFDYVEKKGISYDLNEVLELKTKEKGEKINILFKLLVLIFNEIKSSVDLILDQLESRIFEYCIFNELEIDKNYRAKYLEELKTTKNTTELYNRYFHLRTENPKIINYINNKLSENLATENINLTNEFFNYLNLRIKGEKNQNFWFEFKFFNIYENEDFLLNLKLPSLFWSKKKYNINKELFYYFLEDLDSCRIKLNLKYLAKIYSLDFTRFEKMCERFRALDNRRQIAAFACDFLGKKKLSGFEDKIHERFIMYIFELEKLFIQIFEKRILLGEKIFRILVMSSFSQFSLNGEIFFPKKDNWLKIVK